MATQVSDTGAKTRTRQTADELAVIAQRAQAFTNASGTAIALSEGNADEIICRARSGASAPDVGTALRVEGSFTGLCIQSGKELRCDDAETDTRVDTGAIRALGIRSMVVTPIKDEGKVVGVLAVFAPTAHAFTITHVAVLKTMADQISILLQKERKAREEGVQPEPARPPAPVSVPKPVAAAPVQPPPVVIKPAASPSQRASFPVVSKVEPIKASPVAEEIALPAALPKKDEKRGESKHESRSSLGSFEAAAAGDEKKFPKNIAILGVVAVAIVGASVYAYRTMHKPASPAPVAHAPETPSAVVPAPPSVPGNTAQPSTSAAGSGNTAPAPSAAGKPATEVSAAERRSPDKSAAKNVPPPAPAPVSAPPEKRTPAAVAVSAGTSKIANS